MSVYDRWHKSHPGEGDTPCAEHNRGKTKLYPTAEHLQGDRWQVRWRDEQVTNASATFRDAKAPTPTRVPKPSTPSAPQTHRGENGSIRVLAERLSAITRPFG